MIRVQGDEIDQIHKNVAAFLCLSTNVLVAFRDGSIPFFHPDQIDDEVHDEKDHFRYARVSHGSACIGYYLYAEVVLVRLLRLPAQTQLHAGAASIRI